jgi:hypothetical protein
MYCTSLSESNKQKNFLKILFFVGVLNQCRIRIRYTFVRGMDPRIRIRTKMSWIRNTGLHGLYKRIQTMVLDPDPHGTALIRVAGSGSGSRRAKMTHKNRKKSRIFMFLSTECSLFRAEGFFCSLGVLYGSLGISELQFLIKKIEIKFPAINFFQF